MRRKRKARELLGNVVELGYTTARQDIKRRQLYNANVNAVTTDQSSIVAHVKNDNRSPVKTNSFCSVSHLEQPWQPDKRERCSIILVSSEHCLTSHVHSTGTSKIQNISLQRMQKGTTIMPQGDGQIRLSPRQVLGPQAGPKNSWPDEAWVRSSPAQQGLLQLKDQFKDRFKTKNRDVNESEAGPSCIANEIAEHVEANHFGPQGASSLYIDLGDCNQICEHCKATFWYEERLTLYSKDRQVRYHRCCRGGRVVLPMEPEPPDYIKDLFKDKHFLLEEGHGIS